MKKTTKKHQNSKGKVEYPWESTRDLYPTYTTYIWVIQFGCIRQYGVMFWEELLGYRPKGTQIFTLKNCHIYHHYDTDLPTLPSTKKHTSRQRTPSKKDRPSVLVVNAKPGVGIKVLDDRTIGEIWKWSIHSD